MSCTKMLCPYAVFSTIALLAGSTIATVPSVDELGGVWVDLATPASVHVNASMLDLPIVSNFWGSVGTSPAGNEQVDLFALNSLEIPPFAGCGGQPSMNTTYGCGRLLIDGEHVQASSIKYHADQADRRATVPSGPSSGLVVTSSMRMIYENHAIMWQLNLTNPSSSMLSPKITFELSAMVNEYAHLQWVQVLASDPSQFSYTSLIVGDDGVDGVLSQGTTQSTPSMRSAASLFAFAGVLPDSIDVSSTIPQAHFTTLEIAAHSTQMLRVVLTISTNSSVAKGLAKNVCSSVQAFDNKWEDSKSKWQARWAAAFDPDNMDFSGSLPTLTLDGNSENAAGVERVYYMSILSLLSLMRTNLPLMHDKVFTTSQGENEFIGGNKGGVVIGGAVAYYWDEALSSMLLSFLEPKGRPPTLQAWFTSDLKGKKHNWFALDCAPIGTVYNGCNFSTPEQFQNRSAVSDDNENEGNIKETINGNVYPYNMWSYAKTITSYLRVNNDTEFLTKQAAKSNLTVDQAFEAVVMDWEMYAIPSTHMVDYGGTMDGFSPTYQHVLPGMQGNNIWMMRQLARLRELQGQTTKATQLRAHANAMATETIANMYTSEHGKGWFNVVWPTGSNGTKPLEAHEMRHVVDFFSATFGLCSSTHEKCDLDATARQELSSWFHEELKTKDWIRATSPRCNCSHSWMLPDPTVTFTNSIEWPAISTCKAAREDHGSTGAYTAWPALAAEALCYLDGNCSAAFKVLASFVPTTYNGAFGQANAVPQDLAPPYTPYNDEATYKPFDRRYINMAVGAFCDSIIRGLFAYHPDMQWPSKFSQEALNGMLLSQQPRGFNGTLSNVRTPFGLVSITSDEGGLRIELQKK
eukprot:m.116789 g.116789  ORF g.116789 m.116789 type:complete len:861 (+) comp28539_c0_seq1:178-2760(+)